MPPGLGHGSIDLPVDSGGAIRRLPEGEETLAAMLGDPVARPRKDARIRFDRTGVRTVSFYQAVQADAFLPPDTFRDRVVLVELVLGSLPKTSVDMFRTPLTASGESFMSGVQIHAHEYRTLVSQSWIAPVPGWLVAAGPTQHAIGTMESALVFQSMLAHGMDRDPVVAFAR